MENNKSPSERADEIYHWGILGMKWGQRRFQNKDGSLTPAGKARYDDDPDETPEDRKKRVLESGSADEVLKYKGQLTNQELQQAINRINMERQLNQISESEKKSNWDKVDEVMNKVGKVTDWANKGINAYNILAKVNNSFNDKMKLPPIDGGDAIAKAATEARKKKLLSMSAEEVSEHMDEYTTKELSEWSARRAAEDKVRGRATTGDDTPSDPSVNTRSDSSESAPANKVARAAMERALSRYSGDTTIASLKSDTSEDRKIDWSEEEKAVNHYALDFGDVPIAKIKAYSNTHTYSEMIEKFGVSSSTISKILK